MVRNIYSAHHVQYPVDEEYLFDAAQTIETDKDFRSIEEKGCEDERMRYSQPFDASVSREAIPEGLGASTKAHREPSLPLDEEEAADKARPLETEKHVPLSARKVGRMRVRNVRRAEVSKERETATLKVKNQLDMFVTIEIPNSDRTMSAHVLVDSGCTGSCIDAGFVKRYELPTEQYRRPIPVFNADGTSNDEGMLKEYVELSMSIGDHSETIQLAVTGLASSNIFLGHDWLQRHNPEINWRTGSIKFTRCPEECSVLSQRL